MKKYAMLTDQGTAAAETGICTDCRNPKNENKLKPDSDVKAFAFVDVSDNTAIVCMICGKK